MANQTFDYGPLYMSFGVMGTILTGIGFISNLILSYTFLTDKYFRKVTYYLMFICVISDVIANISLFFGYAALLEEVDDVYIASAICRIVLFIVFISYSISFMNLALIAVDRYFAVVRPLSLFYRLYKKRILCISETCILLLAAFANLPGNLQMGAHKEDTRLCDSVNITEFTSIFMISSSIIRYIIPSMMIIICYWRIIIHQRNYVRPGQLTKHQLAIEIKKRKHIKALMSISAFNVFNTWPFTAFYIGQAITRKSLFQIRMESSVLFVLSIFSLSVISNITILNPFIYMKFDRNIRASVIRNLKYIWALLSCLRYRPKTTFVIASQA